MADDDLKGTVLELLTDDNLKGSSKPQSVPMSDLAPTDSAMTQQRPDTNIDNYADSEAIRGERKVSTSQAMQI